MSEFKDLPQDERGENNNSTLITFEEQLNKLKLIANPPPVVREEIFLCQELITALESGKEAFIMLADHEKLRQARGSESSTAFKMSRKFNLGLTPEKQREVLKLLSGMTPEEANVKVAAAERICDFLEPDGQEIPAREIPGGLGRLAMKMSSKVSADSQEMAIDVALTAGITLFAQKTRFPEMWIVTLRNAGTNTVEEINNIVQSQGVYIQSDFVK